MVLNWEIFEGQHPPSSLVGVYFTNTHDNTEAGADGKDDMFMVHDGLRAAEEERLPCLIESFLQNVWVHMSESKILHSLTIRPAIRRTRYLTQSNW